MRRRRRRASARARGGRGNRPVARAHQRTPCAWPPGGWAEPALHGPAGVAARQLRRNLAARGVDATAAGKLVRVVLPEATEHAAAGAERALGAGSSPSVLLLAGPRPEALDEVLLRQDAIVVAAEPDGDSSLVDLAVATLAEQHPAVSSCALPLGPVARALATAGIAAPIGAGRALAPMLEAVT